MNTTQKLAEISRIMGDGFHFSTMRFALENMANDPDQDSTAQVLGIVDKFYRLCMYIERQGEPE